MSTAKAKDKATAKAGAAATAKNGGMAIGSRADSGNGTAIIQGLPDRLNNNLALGDSATVKNDTNFNVALGSFSTAGDADLTAAAYKPAGVSTVAGDVGEQNVKIGEVSLGGDVSNWGGAEKNVPPPDQSGRRFGRH